jgi:hypothetical protein
MASASSLLGRPLPAKDAERFIAEQPTLLAQIALSR